jgi:general secretion pathway protein K
MSGRKRQRGVAVLTAMLIVTIGTIIAVNLMWQATLDIRRAEATLAADQGLMLVQGAEAWAADILRQDQVDSPNSDNLSEQWAIDLPPLPVDGGTITGKLEDLQGRFNAVVDWLDPDTDMRFPSGGEDVAYSGIDPPYRTANGTITSVSELMAVTGFDREFYTRVAPYVAALPIGTKLNVNTASDVLLASLSDDIDIAMAGALVDERGGAEFPDIDATFEGLVEPEVLMEIDGVSEHFLLTATVALGTNQLTMRSLLQRDPSGITRALFRSLGVE